MIEVLRSGQLSLGPRVAEFERLFAARVGRAARERRLAAAPPGLHLALRAVGVQDGDEVDHEPVLVRRLGQRGAVRARAAGVRRHRPGHAQPRPGGRRGGGHASARGRCCRCTSSATPPTCRRSSDRRAARPGDRRGRLRGARGAPRRRHARSAARGHPAVFGFYANKQLTTGEGGMVTLGDARAEGADRLRAQPGPRAGHGLARPRPARLQLPPLGHRLRARASRSCERLEEMLAGARAGRRRSTARRSPGSRGSSCPARTRGGDVRGWFVFVVQLPARRRPRRDGPRAAPRAGIQSKPYLPAIHLMSFYRERFGHREGEFPVCEDVAARSLALPFFPEMSEGQVARVSQRDAARRSLDRRRLRRTRRARVPLPRAPAPRLPAR